MPTPREESVRAELVAIVERQLRFEGDPDAARRAGAWLHQWMMEDCPCLQATPQEFLERNDDGAGAAEVRGVVMSMISGAYR